MRLSCGPRSSWDNPSSAGWADDECLATIITPWAPMLRSRCRGQTDGWRCGQDGTAGSRPAARSQGFREIRLRVDRSSARRIVSSTEILPGTEKAVNRPPSSSRRRCLQKPKKKTGCNLERGGAPRQAKATWLRGFLFYLQRGEDGAAGVEPRVPLSRVGVIAETLVAHGQRSGGDVWTGHLASQTPASRAGAGFFNSPRRSGPQGAARPSLLPSMLGQVGGPDRLLELITDGRIHVEVGSNKYPLLRATE
jgi:hypothetical protein